MKTHILAIKAEEIKKNERGVMAGASVRFSGSPMILGNVLASIMKENHAIKEMVFIAMGEYIGDEIEQIDDEAQEEMLKKGSDAIN